jgi:hypothetical protein
VICESFLTEGRFGVIVSAADEEDDGYEDREDGSDEL